MSNLSDHLKLAIGQLNPVVGDVAGNLDRARKARVEAARQGADLLVLPELFISGYPPEDLILRPAFIDACLAALADLAADTADGPAVLIGTPWREGDKLFNSVALLAEGVVAARRHKVDLPNYGVFDEKRLFAVGPEPLPISFKGFRLGLPICEDLWSEPFCVAIGEAGAEILLSIHGSPYWRGKHQQRLEIAAVAAKAAGAPVIYANMVGGQDELVFDGASFGLDAAGEIAFQLSRFDERIESVSIARDGSRLVVTGPREEVPTGEDADWAACVVGLRDYVEKNGFADVVLGLSGGIDSAVVAAMAVDALGPGRVRCIMLPYRYTSEASLTDAADCAHALGVRYDVVPIAAPVEGAEAALAGLFEGRATDVTEENLQARMRGVLLMAVSNKFGNLLLTTGNKSEVSVGYSTLYGDMNGGFNPIKDLFKTEVLRLAAWRNANRPARLKGPAGEIIPRSILTKAPTAELRENQTDQDSLPPYDQLDRILVALIEEERSVTDIIGGGHDAATVRRIARLVAIAEYKRRQAAPGVKVTKRNFGRDRRYPITNRFSEG